MRVIFYAANKEREINIANAMHLGFKNHGHSLVVASASDYVKPNKDYDLACMFGVKGSSRNFLEDHRAEGMKTLFFDKGYLNRGVYIRVSVNSFHPTQYFRKSRGNDRLIPFNVVLKDRVNHMKRVMLVSSSQKYHTFYRLGDATEYCTNLIHTIKLYTPSQILYRPKPSWTDAVPIEGSTFAQVPRKFQQILKGCGAIITHGSSAAIEGMIEGIPAIMLSDHPMSVLSHRCIASINSLTFPSEPERYQFLNDITYCQWKLSEMASGEAWETLKEDL